jgi:hypothetical protein
MTTQAASTTKARLTSLIYGERVAAPCFSKPACPRCMVRTVTENGRTLRFTSQGFEEE